MIAVEYEKPILTNKDLIDRDITPMLPRGSIQWENLKTSPISRYRKIYQIVEEKGGWFMYTGLISVLEIFDKILETGEQCLVMVKEA